MSVSLGFANATDEVSQAAQLKSNASRANVLLSIIDRKYARRDAGLRSGVKPRGDSPSKPLRYRRLLEGTTLGSYRLLSLLGEGAVGRVYLAEHTTLGRKVALKMLKSELSHHPKLVNRFFLEARAVNEIAHENIVAITDFIEDQGQYYFIMELLKGLTLDRLLREEGPQSARFAALIGAQLASALGAVHSKGFIHRDLKPANIYLVPKDSGYFVKLLDFGVAKLVTAGGGQFSANTAVGDLVGTPDYMSPEQARAMTVDHRIDLYALGAVLYEIVTGERVFPRDGLENVLKAHILDTPEPPSSKRPVPPSLEALILRCLEKDPARRPQTALEVETELRAMISAVPKPGAKASKRRAPMVVAVTAVLAVAAAAGAYWLK